MTEHTQDLKATMINKPWKATGGTNPWDKTGSKHNEWTDKEQDTIRKNKSKNTVVIKWNIIKKTVENNKDQNRLCLFYISDIFIFVY